MEHLANWEKEFVNAGSRLEVSFNLFLESSSVFLIMLLTLEVYGLTFFSGSPKIIFVDGCMSS
jgi:hypothetical protein